MQTAQVNDTSMGVRRFFIAIDQILLDKNKQMRNAADTGPAKKAIISFDARYALNDGIIWEPFYDRKHKKHGWRPMRSRGLIDWMHRIKHGHDKDFKEWLPEGPARFPADSVNELWSWKDTDIRPAIHYFMLKQEYQEFHTFALLAAMLRPHLEKWTTCYEHADTFANSRAYQIGQAAWDIDWINIRRFHAEVMEMMKKIP